MASVGGVNCTFVRGGANQPKTRLELWQVPGIDGYGAMDVGRGDASFQFLLVKYGSTGTVESWILSIEALQGEVVSITDDHDTVHANCLVVRVGLPVRTAEQGYGGVRGQILIQGVCGQ